MPRLVLPVLTGYYHVTLCVLILVPGCLDFFTLRLLHSSLRTHAHLPAGYGYRTLVLHGSRRSAAAFGYAFTAVTPVTHWFTVHSVATLPFAHTVVLAGLTPTFTTCPATCGWLFFATRLPCGSFAVVLPGLIRVLATFSFVTVTHRLLPRLVGFVTTRCYLRCLYTTVGLPRLFYTGCAVCLDTVTFCLQFYAFYTFGWVHTRFGYLRLHTTRLHLLRTRTHRTLRLYRVLVTVCGCGAVTHTVHHTFYGYHSCHGSWTVHTGLPGLRLVRSRYTFVGLPSRFGFVPTTCHRCHAGSFLVGLRCSSVGFGSGCGCTVGLPLPTFIPTVYLIDYVHVRLLVVYLHDTAHVTGCYTFLRLHLRVGYGYAVTILVPVGYVRVYGSAVTFGYRVGLRYAHAFYAIRTFTAPPPHVTHARLRIPRGCRIYRYRAFTVTVTFRTARGLLCLRAVYTFVPRIRYTACRGSLVAIRLHLLPRCRVDSRSATFPHRGCITLPFVPDQLLLPRLRFTVLPLVVVTVPVPVHFYCGSGSYHTVTCLRFLFVRLPLPHVFRTVTTRFPFTRFAPAFWVRYCRLPVAVALPVTQLHTACVCYRLRLYPATAVYICAHLAGCLRLPFGLFS